MSDDVEAIARSLTKAQRNALTGKRPLQYGSGMWSLRNALRRKGILEGFGAQYSPLGLRIRQSLLSSPVKE